MMIYILDGEGQPVGPFKNRENVKRFIKMMALCSEDWTDSRIVAGGGEVVPALHAVPTDSRANRFGGELKVVRGRP